MKSELLPPPAFSAHLMRLDDETFVVFSWPTTEVALPPSLTKAERDVLQRWLDGATARGIADARRSSVRTVQNQLRSIYQKLGVSSRVEICGALLSRGGEKRG